MSSPAGGPYAAFSPAANPSSGIGAYPTGRPARAAQAVAAHESPRATKRYDRTSDEITLDEITLDEIEDILI